MTDRFKGCTVAFDRDIREDDAEAVLAALRQIRGVASVEPIQADADDLIVRMRFLQDVDAELHALRRRLWELGK